MEKNFKDTVNSMKPSQIVMAMVNGLKNKHYHVYMQSYGTIHNGICYGCAATNTICEISKKKFYVENIVDRKSRAEFIEYDYVFLHVFETGVNYLREGHYISFLYVLNNLDDYNLVPVEPLINNIEEEMFKVNGKIGLTNLSTDTYQDYLHEYITFAKILEKFEN